MRWSSTNMLEAKMLSFDYVDNLYEDVAGHSVLSALKWSFKMIQDYPIYKICYPSLYYKL